MGELMLDFEVWREFYNLIAGADIINVCAQASMETIAGAIEETRRWNRKVAAITWDPGSELANLGDIVVVIKSEAIPRKITGYTTRELMGLPLPPLGSLFEISTLIFFEACVLELMNRLGIEEKEMRKIHANL